MIALQIQIKVNAEKNLIMQNPKQKYNYTPRNEVRGGILESPCPSFCRRMRG